MLFQKVFRCVFRFVCRFLLGALFVGFALASVSCSYITPESENPLPGLLDQGFVVQNGRLYIEKSFFGFDINEKEKTTNRTSKKWLCGEAPVDQAGFHKNLAGWDYVPRSGHCNLQFVLSDDGSQLVAREIDLSYSKLEEMPKIYSIPIVKHFFYERETDSRGRQLNQFRAVTDRSNWALRPYIELDLSGLVTHIRTRSALSQTTPRKVIHSISDIEVEKKKNANFLGFTMSVTATVRNSRGLTREVALEERVNILEFIGTPGFKKTPYDLSVAQHMNILHILGKSVDGFHQVDWAAHWDFSQPKEICLNGWPNSPGKNYQRVAEEVVDELNEALRRTNVIQPEQKGFVVSRRKMKFHYDLRCPSLTWINDPHLSFNAPLGIGLVNTDISTGEILWGGGIIWGGLIDYIVNRDSAAAAIDSMTQLTFERLKAAESLRDNPYYEDIHSRMEKLLVEQSGGGSPLSSLPGFDLIKNGLPEAYRSLTDQLKSMSTMSLEELSEKYPDADHEFLYQRLKDFDQAEDLQTLQASHKSLNPFRSDLFPRYKALVHGPDFEPSQWNRMLLQASALGAKLEKTPEESQTLSGAKTVAQATNLYLQSRNGHYDYLGLYDLDNTFENYYAQWTHQILENESLIGQQVAALSVVKFVTLHELGHVVGLGHQFAGNQMPMKGQIPDALYGGLKKADKKGLYYSSIMDYLSGETQIDLPLDQIQFQLQDQLVFQYLYNQTYFGYTPGEEKLRPFPLMPDGQIPKVTMTDDQGPVKTVSLPQCSDIDAWLASNPYCRRFDKGSSAPDMVQENIDEYLGTLTTRLNSFTGAGGGNTWLNTYRLWRYTYNVLNTNRTFYDTLRYKLRADSRYSSLFSKMVKEPQAMLAFSKACKDPVLAPPSWAQDFAQLSLQGLHNRVFRQEDLEHYEAALSFLGYEEKVKIGLTDMEYDRLEDEMHTKGTGFSEVQKLCRATSKSLNFMNTLLSHDGPDHPTINWEDSISPTGIRGGNSTQDTSFLFGRSQHLGLLPLKLSTLDVLTDVSSTMSVGPWRVNKPQFIDPRWGGKTGYYPLYPSEFSDIISTSVIKNMNFADSFGNPVGTIGISNLYSNGFLNRTFEDTNETVVGYNENYLNEIRNQTQFFAQLVAVIMEPNTKTKSGAANRAYGFKPPTVYDPYQNQFIDLEAGYVLPEGRTIVWGLEGQIILPISKLRFSSDSRAFFWAMEISYDQNITANPHLRQLENKSVKTRIRDLANQEFDDCTGGEFGLKNYFSLDNAYDQDTNPDGFRGFLINKDIAKDPVVQRAYEQSVYDAFQDYHAKVGKKYQEKYGSPMQKECAQSYKGLGLAGATALALNGWFLPEVLDYLRK